MTKIHNDGKEKWQSFEATWDEQGICLQAYGESEQEAIDNLREERDNLIMNLNNIDFNEVVYVDWKGDTIQQWK